MVRLCVVLSCRYAVGGRSCTFYVPFPFESSKETLSGSEREAAFQEAQSEIWNKIIEGEPLVRYRAGDLHPYRTIDEMRMQMARNLYVTIWDTGPMNPYNQRYASLWKFVPANREAQFLPTRTLTSPGRPPKLISKPRG